MRIWAEIDLIGFQQSRDVPSSVPAGAGCQHGGGICSRGSSIIASINRLNLILICLILFTAAAAAAAAAAFFFLLAVSLPIYLFFILESV